ncbi:hypothetical protein GBA52_009734 [Prunus armeniaca]|nr:hypothetical protein GBA52_009734 [Prunus armeniaca]
MHISRPLKVIISKSLAIHVSSQLLLGEEKKVHKASLLVLCLKLIHLQQQLIAEDMILNHPGSNE